MAMLARRCNRYVLCPIFQVSVPAWRQLGHMQIRAGGEHGYDILWLPILFVGRKAHCKEVGMKLNEPQLLCGNETE